MIEMTLNVSGTVTTTGRRAGLNFANVTFSEPGVTSSSAAQCRHSRERHELTVGDTSPPRPVLIRDRC